MAPPLIIVGLDGASFNLLTPLFKAGHMPHLQHLAQSGLRADLLSTLPVATLPAWTSFLTGCEPARHGVTDLFSREGAGEYGLEPATGALRAMPTFLAQLSAQGLRVL